jgi:tetratricopeptide (TPR) repeat protein
LKLNKLLLLALVVTIAGCSLEKESGFNRSMQNLTAHYNILFNAKEILRLKQESYATSFVDDYNEVLSVYQDTTVKTKTPDKDLELAIVKANTIITIKEQSKYLGDAYLILGKANYLEGNYFNAVEYFSYVIRSFPKRKDLLQEALVWKTRTLMYLDQLPQAKPVIDTAILTIDPKKKAPADIYATKLQYDINAGDYTDGEEMAKKAVQYCGTKTQRLRWTFILAQLQELNGKTADASKNYAQIAESNALFEMAFNASLNLIRIEDMQNGVKINRIDRLLSLLKNPNDKEFKDQIYYQVAQLELIDKKINEAIKYYNLSIRSSTKNQNQKGLSYLRLAEIYFKNKNDYLTSKKYYDSTLTTLSVNYPGYQAIQKRGNNLQLLADRLQIITREDTLQALARMDEKTRLATIDKMVNDRTLQQLAVANNAAAGATGITNNTGAQLGSSSSGGSFYFDNSSAVGQGFADFRKTWGNRKLEDNWRRSSRTTNNIVGVNANSIQGSDPDAPMYQSQNNIGSTPAGNYRRELIQGLPLTPALLAQSNQRVYNAYTDIGNFYRDVLEDKSEAIETFELMLTRFPNDPNRPAIYYNLYRLYSDLDKSKSDLYKNKLLKEYPATPFAQIISDPEYAKKLDDKNAGLTQAYNVVFDLYTHKQYKEVIDCVPEVMKQYPGNNLSAQLYYLQTLSAGHFEPVGPFRDSLQSILNKYPNDRLISPLITQHLTFINENKAEMLTRKVVLADDDPRDIPFTLARDLQENAAYQHPQRPALAVQPEVKAPEKKQEVVAKQPEKPAAEVPHEKPAVVVQPEKPVLAEQPAKAVIQTETTAPPPVKPPDIAPSIFSMSDSTNYYFVVNVNSGTTNLSSSRFGIGQFDRANYQGKGIKHQLIAIESDNQLIYVGRFMTLEGVKNYARQIVPLLPDIMKVPRDKYSFFIITQENLNKLADKKTLDSYIDYYQKNY